MKLIVRTLLLLVGFYGIKTAAERLSALPADGYLEASLLLATLTTLGAGRLRAVLALGALVGGLGLVAWSARRSGRSLFGVTWAEVGGPLRLVGTAAAVAVVWPLVTAAPSGWSGSTHGLERLVLLVGLGWTVWRPLGALGVGCLCMPSLFALSAPLGGFSYAAVDVPVYALLLLGAATCLRAAVGWRMEHPSTSALVALVAANHWRPAVDLVLALGEPVGRLVSPAMALPGVAFGVVGAGLTLFVLAGRRWTLGVLLGCLATDVGVLVVSGVAFWQWALVEVALLVALGRKADLLPNGGWAATGMGVLLVVGSPLWCSPARLFVQPAAGCHVEATGRSGATYVLSPAFFAPYEQVFARGELSYLGPGSRAGSYTLRRREAFDALVVRYLRSATEPESAWRVLRAPPDVWKPSVVGAYRREEPLVAASVICNGSSSVPGAPSRPSVVRSIRLPSKDP